GLLAQFRVDAAGEDDTARALGAKRLDNDAVGRAVVHGAGQRLDDRAALHLMVVDAKDVGFGGDAGVGEQGEEVRMKTPTPALPLEGGGGKRFVGDGRMQSIRPSPTPHWWRRSH